MTVRTTLNLFKILIVLFLLGEVLLLKNQQARLPPTMGFRSATMSCGLQTFGLIPLREWQKKLRKLYIILS